MDTAQLMLIIVVVILTGLLLILGIQVYLILREFRKTIVKANKVLEEIEILTQSVAEPLSKLSSFTTSFKAGAAISSALKLLAFFQGKKHHKKQEEEDL